ncbi:MAG: hypothetical protein GX079_06320 [Tissierellia bacterium]|nr:hypothetical protein [Tissierellia bacterium]
MRKYIVILLALVLLLGQASCSNDQERGAVAQEPKNEVIEEKKRPLS